MVEQIALETMEYDKLNAKNINHFVSVYAYASLIGKLEKLDNHTQTILEIAALVHDIAVKVCVQNYGVSSPELQEKEGPAIAHKLLEKFSLNSEDIDRICYLVGHHHTYKNINGKDYQILVEADFIVNFFEGYTSIEHLETIKNKIFKTKSAISILEKMF